MKENLKRINQKEIQTNLIIERNFMRFGFILLDSKYPKEIIKKSLTKKDSM